MRLQNLTFVESAPGMSVRETVPIEHFPLYAHAPRMLDALRQITMQPDDGALIALDVLTEIGAPR